MEISNKAKPLMWQISIPVDLTKTAESSCEAQDHHIYRLIKSRRLLGKRWIPLSQNEWFFIFSCSSLCHAIRSTRIAGFLCSSSPQMARHRLAPSKDG